jgi:hypothetical protein
MLLDGIDLRALRLAWIYWRRNLPESIIVEQTIQVGGMALCQQQLVRVIPETCVTGKVVVLHVQYQQIKWQSVQQIAMAIMFGT